MNLSDVTALLGMVQAFDRRTVGDADEEAWLWILESYDLADAKAALRQFKHDQPGVWVEPGHLAQIIDEWREQWSHQQRIGPKPPGWFPGSGPTISGEEFGRQVEAAGGWDAWVKARDERDRARAIAAQDGPKAINGGPQ
jgi:hypothetical protein